MTARELMMPTVGLARSKDFSWARHVDELLVFLRQRDPSGQFMRLLHLRRILVASAPLPNSPA